MRARIAVVGAGISGLSCARLLKACGHEVVVLDKSRGSSGRMATRRHEQGAFDHGAQYFTVSEPEFTREVASWASDGVVAPWRARFGRLGPEGWNLDAPDKVRYVGTPSMSAICRHLSAGLELRLGARVKDVRRIEGSWNLRLVDGSEVSDIDAVALACPGPQASMLLVDREGEGPAGHSTDAGLADLSAEANEYLCTWALMLRFDAPIQAPYDAMTFDNGVLSWAARDSSKPGRQSNEHWVVHASNEWSEAHVAENPAAVVPALVQAFTHHVDLGAAKVTVAIAHRWRYARAIARSGQTRGWVWQPQRRLGLCGDGVSRSTVESAWCSGMGLAQQMAREGARWAD